ncbi:hypothetical protein ACQUSR_20140 [Streptomyces sp. P1-3]|uniref:hypothetical protein n=1 Tax=Streptomyces sp. P1-3 TaxID=3421658 RepID=UPI003D35E5E1
MAVQPDPPGFRDRRVHVIPHTINAIGDALTGEKRARFYAEVLAAEEGEPINTVMRKWWMEAMFNKAPGAERSRANAAAGRNLVPVDRLAARLGTAE